jgi:2-aminoadipate transaminase
MSLDLDALWSQTGAALAGSAIRQMGLLAAGRPDVISFAPGYPDAAMFAWDEYHAIADDILRASSPETLQYSPTRGFDRLLDTVRPWLGRRGVQCRPDELLITTGSQQGIDLLTRVLVDPGDVVLVELPTFTGAIAAFRNARADLHGVEQDAEGLDLDHLQSTITRLRAAGRRIKCLYVIPNFQNPTGGLMSRARRRALLDLVTRERVLLVEDDPYGDLSFDPALGADATRPLKADDREGVVVYLQSTSKTLAPAFRTAWAVGPAALLARLEIAKQSTDLCSSGLDQRMVAEAIARGVFERDLPALRARYASRCQAMIDALSTHASSTLSWRRPQGGFFVWAEARAMLDGEVVRRAIEAGVVYVGGAPFYVDGRASRALRLAFSAAPLTRIDEGIRRLASVMASLAPAV